MWHERVGFFKHWLLYSKLSLEEVCSLVQNELELPAFKFGDEVEHEWGECEMDGVEVNVSRSKLSRRERLEELEHGCPDHNFVLCVLVAKDLLDGHAPNWFLDTTLICFSQRIANLLSAEVYHVVDVRGEKGSRYVAIQPSKQNICHGGY